MRFSYVVWLACAAAVNAGNGRMGGQTLEVVRATGSEIVVAVKRVGCRPSSCRYSVEAGKPDGLEQPHVVSIDTDILQLDNVRVLASDLVGLVGNAANGRQAFAIIDLAHGEKTYEQQCESLRFTFDRGGRYLCVVNAKGDQIAYSITRRSANPTFSAVDGALKILSSAPIKERRKVLFAFAHSKQLQESPEIKSAIVHELHATLAADIAAAAEHPAVRGLRPGSEGNLYLDQLVTTVEELRDLSTLPLVVQADVMAIRGLWWYGAAAVAPTIAALRRPVPTGYSGWYRANLLTALGNIERRSVISHEQSRAIAEVVRPVLASGNNPRELRAALDLAERIDEPEFDRLVQQIAWDVGALQARGVPAEDVLPLKTAAQQVLNRRIIIQ